MIPVAMRLQSPKSPFLLGSNDDQLERAHARAIRAASARRKAMVSPPSTAHAVPCLSREQIIELFQNCIKLATENKINQKNTWELRLIDHLSEIIKVETEDDAETNFQKASCTLEAGVKIYSLRVDSVHSEAYKVLGRIIRAGGEKEEEHIEHMVMNMPVKNEISPTLKDIINHFNDDNQSLSHTINEGQKSAGCADAVGNNNIQLDGDFFGNFEPGNFDHEQEITVVGESFTFGRTTFSSHCEEDEPCTSFEPDMAGRSEEIAAFLFKSSLFTTKQNAWAGPDHWKYHKPKGSEDVPVAEGRLDVTTKRIKDNKLAEHDIDFSKSLDQKTPDDIFVPPKNPMTLLLPANRLLWESKLPEDCHYQPEDLVKMFLLPNVMEKRKKIFRYEPSPNSVLHSNYSMILSAVAPNVFYNNSWQQNNNSDEQLPSWDNESRFDGQYDDGYVHGDLDDSVNLVSQPCQVCKDAFSFKHILATFPDECREAVPKDISPHLCFICLLHLANEHGLSIYDCPTLDDLTILLPSSCPSMLIDSAIEPSW
ncbi:hypothetical protein LguiB_030198 [Lonicera macranthoides]